jgi:hypothetical protein
LSEEKKPVFYPKWGLDESGKPLSLEEFLRRRARRGYLIEVVDVSGRPDRKSRPEISE